MGFAGVRSPGRHALAAELIDRGHRLSVDPLAYRARRANRTLRLAIGRIARLRAPHVRAAHVALGGFGLSVAAVAYSVVLWSGERFARPPVTFMTGPLPLTAEMTLAITYAAVGAILAARQPRNPIGWLFLAIGVGTSVQLPAYFLVAQAHHTMRLAPPETMALAWIASSLHVPFAGAMMILVILLFPDGRLAPGRSWAGAPLALAGGGLLSLALGFDPAGLLWFPSLANPLAAPAATSPLIAAVRVIGVALMLAAIVISTRSMVIRYRSATALQRQALKWLTLAITVLVATGAPFLVARYLSRTASSTGEVLFVAVIVAATLLPAAAAIGMLRHRLFDVDIIVNRTLVYVPLMAILSGLYAASVALFQRIFVALTGDTSDVAIVITTLVLASAFTPLRKALEGLVDRRFKPAEADSKTVATAAPATGPVMDPVLADRLAALESQMAALGDAACCRAACRPSRQRRRSAPRS